MWAQKDTGMAGGGRINMKWTEKQTKPTNRVDRGHKLKTLDFETNLYKGHCVGIRTGNFFCMVLHGLWDKDEQNYTRCKT